MSTFFIVGFSVASSDISVYIAYFKETSCIFQTFKLKRIRESPVQKKNSEYRHFA